MMWTLFIHVMRNIDTDMINHFSNLYPVIQSSFDCQYNNVNKFNSMGEFLPGNST